MKQWFLKLILFAGILVSVTQGPQAIQAAENQNKIGEITTVNYTETIEFVNNLRSDASADSIMSFEEAIKHLKDNAVAKEASISIIVSRQIYDQYGAEGLLKEAFAHSEESKSYEGDTITFEMGNDIPITIQVGSEQVNITYTMSYRLTKEQEQAVQAEVTRALSTLALDGKTEQQKVAAIYSYICDNVNYDRGATLGELTYTSYSAAINKKAVCQGYAVLFYRMCIEAGLDARIIAGTGNGGAHAWNIVRIGNEYYNVDCTWDGQDEASFRDYFLKSEADFGDHIRKADYLTEAFVKEHPMSQVSWFDYAEIGEKWNRANLSSQEFTTLAETVVTNVGNGKPKLLVFYRTTCSNSMSFLKSLAASNYSDAEIIALEIDGNEKSTIESYATTIGGSNITFCYDNTNRLYNLLFEYVGNLLGEDAVKLPCLVYIDRNNKVQYMGQGFEAVGTVKERITLLSEDAVALSNIQLNLSAGASSALEVTIGGEKRNPQCFTWESSDKNIATVDANGKVTAISEGTASITCSAGDSIKLQAVVEVSAHVHVLDNGTITKEATCKEKGIMTYKCTLCDTYSKTEEIPVADHKEVIDEAVASTCKSTGKTQGSHCEYCKKVLVAQNDIPMTNHVAGVGTITKEATCEEKGTKSYSCKWCDKIVRNEEIEALGHEMVVDEAIEPTYTSYGKTEGSHCQRCNQVQVAQNVISAKEGLAQDAEGNWYYYRNAEIDTSYSSLAKYGGSWWYVEKGKLNFGYTGLAQYGGSWWYIKSGKLDFGYTGLCKYNGYWWYVEKGKVNFNYNSLAKHAGSWWHVEDGKVDFGYTGLAKYSGSWWYIKNGKLDFGYTGLAQYGGSWWYMKNGKLDFNYTGLAKYDGSWWYIKNGKLDFGYTGLAKHGGSWWYMKNGKLDFSYTGLAKYSGSWWYMKKGKLDFSYTGLAQYAGSWWYMEKGKLNFGYTGLAWYGNSWWYVKNGKLDFSYSGITKYAGYNWQIKSGKMINRL